MSIKKIENNLKKFSNECIECGICLNSCELLKNLGLFPAEIAKMVSENNVSEELLAAIQRCALCGHCSTNCLVNLNPSKLIQTCREELVNNGQILKENYDVMLVNRDWNFFTIYRETYSIRYDDLNTDTYDVLFFPGCTMSTYAPELSRAAHTWLADQGYRIGFTDSCCGKPLESIGLVTEREQYLTKLEEKIKQAGVHLIVTACPNCEQQLRMAQIPHVTVRSLYSMLVEAEFSVSGSSKITIHDSCPDRYDSSNPQVVRKLLGGFQQFEMASNGKETICCGSGGIVSVIDPDLCNSRAENRITEFLACGADYCVTSCMSCALRLSRFSPSVSARHCLELVFDKRVDYEDIDHKAREMWEGIQGDFNRTRLSQAKIITDMPIENSNNDLDLN